MNDKTKNNKTTEDKKDQKEEIPKVDNTKMKDITQKDVFPEKNQNAVDAVIEKAKAEAQEQPKKRGPGRPPKNKPKEPEINMGSVNAAQVTSGVLEQLQVNMISNDFKYTEAERIQNIDAWRKTFDHYGGVELSPPMELALSHASIMLVRAQKPGFITKREMLRIWLKEKVSSFWKNFKKKKGKENAQHDRRENNERENNVGEKESQSLKGNLPE